MVDIYSLLIVSFKIFKVMAQSDARFGYRAKLARTDHDLSQPFGLRLPGQLLPIWFDLWLLQAKVITCLMTCLFCVLFSLLLLQ